MKITITLDIPDIINIPAVDPFNADEHAKLLDIFTLPLVKRYINHLMMDKMTQSVSIPLPETQDQIFEHSLRHAQLKGSLSILHTLNSIQKPAPRVQQSREPD